MKREDCIFCKIVEGEIPSIKIYEDDDVLAFMFIGLLVNGHALVIPKAHHDPMDDLPQELLFRVMCVVQRLVKAQREGLGADGVNVHQANGAAAGQVVPHMHVHVIPRYHDDAFHWNWTPHEYESMDEATALAARMSDALRQEDLHDTP